MVIARVSGVEEFGDLRGNRSRVENVIMAIAKVREMVEIGELKVEQN